ncbi:hypothetical protein DXG01_007376 [Tephrocybe rancida]|nr:hypothetical protein DXG01_007376 [Tephrocybe rancida]
MTPTNRPVRKEREGQGITRANIGQRYQATANKTASKTLTPSSGLTSGPPSKRRKVGANGAVPRLGPLGTWASRTQSRRSLPTRSTDIIDVDSDFEDQGVVVTRNPVQRSTPDRMDLLNTPRSAGSVKDPRPPQMQMYNSDHDQPVSATALGKRKMVPPRFRPNHDDDEIESESMGSINEATGSRLPKDGDATRELEAKIVLTSDPILEYSPPPRARPSGGRVKEQVRIIDFKVMEQEEKRTKSLKKGMKDKMRINGNAFVIRNGVPGKSLFPQTMPSAPPAGSSRPSKAKKLRLDKWYYGMEFRQGSSDYFLSWGKDAIEIWDGEHKILWLKLVEELSLIEYMEGAPYIIKLETKRPRLVSFDRRNHDQFKMGDLRTGTVVIWMDEAQDDAKETYQSFLRWFKGSKQHCAQLCGPAGFRVWEMYARKAARHEAEQGPPLHNRQTGQPPPLRHSLAPDDDQDFTLPSVAELSQQDPSSRHDVSVSSRPPSRMITQNKPEGVRRSTRGQRSPTLDPEEVILCYPQGIPGAVYIKNSDYRRLDPGEYLNDTLIEFGLNPDDGYESVRKWTAKIDIFSKKYIIVPINEHLHWYLVIIYQPEHVLTPPPPPLVVSPITRGRKKAGDRLESVFASPPSPVPSSPSVIPKPLSASSKQLHKSSSTVTTTTTTTTTTTLAVAPSSDVEVVQSNEAEEERRISENLLQLDASCTVDVEILDSMTPPTIPGGPFQVDNETTASDSPLTPTEPNSPMEVESRSISPTVSDFDNSTPGNNHFPHDVDMEDESSKSSSRDHENTIVPQDNKHDPMSISISAASFYAKAGARQKAIPNLAAARRDDRPAPVLARGIVVDDNDHIDEPPTPTPAAKDVTYIFTFDSLGSKHPQAIRNLTRYLKKEAHDKLQKEDTSTAVGKQAQTRTKGTANTTRQDDWKGDLTGDMRERIRKDIDGLSVDWKKDRAAKEEARRKEAGEEPSIELIESSDDEIDIVETTPAPPVSGKAMASKATKKGGRRKAPQGDSDAMTTRQAPRRSIIADPSVTARFGDDTMVECERSEKAHPTSRPDAHNRNHRATHPTFTTFNTSLTALPMKYSTTIATTNEFELETRDVEIDELDND